MVLLDFAVFVMRGHLPGQRVDENVNWFRERGAALGEDRDVVVD